MSLLSESLTAWHCSFVAQWALGDFSFCFVFEETWGGSLYTWGPDRILLEQRGSLGIWTGNYTESLAKVCAVCMQDEDSVSPVRTQPLWSRLTQSEIELTHERIKPSQRLKGRCQWVNCMMEQNSAAFNDGIIMKPYIKKNVQYNIKIVSHVKKQESMIYSEAWGLLNTNQPQEDKEFRINRTCKQV